MPVQKRCRTDIPETCSQMATWEPGPVCPFVCSGAGECSGECQPGSRRCAGTGGLQPELCGDSGRWAAEGAVCPALCTAGMCMNCAAGTILRNGMCISCGGNNQPCCGGNACSAGNNLQCMSGTCRVQLPNGNNCNSGSECQSGRCTDGRCCVSTCSTCQRCTGGGGTCELPSNVRVCNGQCISSSECCNCNTSNRCDGNRVVRGSCNNGTCGTQTVDTCGSCEECSGGSCRPRSCPNGQRCVEGSCRKPDGENCGNNSECISGRCAGPMACDGGSTANCPCTPQTVDNDCESQRCSQRQRKCGGYTLPDPGYCG